MNKQIFLSLVAFLSLFILSGCESAYDADVYYDYSYSSEALIILIATVVVFIIIVYLTVVLARFKKELRFINNEIARNTGKEREYWLKKRRRLWLSLIPFFPY